MKKIRLLLIEDRFLLREGLMAMLRKQRDITIVPSQGRKENALLKIHQLRPNVILLDLGLRSLNSLHVVEQVKKEFRRAKVIVMDLAPVQGDIMQFVRAGAAGFVLKDATHDEFLRTIRSVAQGERVLPPLLAESLFSQIVEHAVESGKAEVRGALKMTSRERSVIRLVSEGLGNSAISRKLHIPTHAIKSHIRNVMEKLALHARIEAAGAGVTARAPGRTGRRKVAIRR